MYTEFYGLKEKPFALVPDPRYLFLAKGHREALAHLLYGIEEGEGFIEVIGDVGTGKTTLCRTLLERVGPDVDIAFIFNPSGSEIELLAAISREFGLPTGVRSRPELLESLNAFLLARKAEGRREVLVIDEAQNLAPRVLEQIRLLSNLETEREKLIQIVLIGQPELEENLSRNDMRQLRQRVTVRWSLHPLSRSEVEDYVAHRVNVAGGQPDLFTMAAIAVIYRASRGVPRLINAISDRALLAGYSLGKRTIDASTVRQAMRELPLPGNSSGRWLLGLPARAAGVLICLGLMAGVIFAAWAPQRGSGGSGDSDTPVLPGVSSISVPTGGPLGAERIVPASPRRAAAPENLLRLETARTSAAAALDALVRSWGYETTLDNEVDPNLFADLVSEFSSLRVFVTRSSQAQLAGINLPVILELSLEPGERRYAALLAFDASGAELALGTERFEVSPRQLERLWTGRTFFFWMNFESLPALATGMSGSAVRWLQARLTELGYLGRGDASGEFDTYTAGAIRRFQTAHALPETGEVGPGTLITLYQALDYETPRLAVGGTGS